MKRLNLGMAVAASLLAAGCAPHAARPAYGDITREALAGVDDPVPAALPLAPEGELAERPSPSDSLRTQREISRGSGRFIHPKALSSPREVAAGDGTITLNFEDQPIEAVVKAILGDLLDANYSVAPGVRGTVSFSTSKPVRREEALPILENLLSWTGNALIHERGRYTVVPISRAVAGRLAPSLGAHAPRDGLSARLFPLRFVAAPEMVKLLTPFAETDSILLSDPARNVLVIAGTRDELDTIAETIDTFDVDWVSGMSVGVFGLRNAGVTELMPALDSVFGQKSGAPVAGLIRFIPIERTNAIVVISTQAEHVEQVGEWIERIDRGGGNEPRLFVYDVRNLLASDVARYVGNIFGGAVSGDSPQSPVVPGLTGFSLGMPAGDGGGLAEGGTADGDTSFFQPPSTPSTPSSGDGKATIRITAVDANNQLMIHARPSQWADIRQAIDRLDAVPLQVQIETRILEVVLRDNFRFGVQWYLEGLAGGNGAVSQPGNKQQWALGSGGGKPSGADTLFYSFVNKNVQVALRAMETNGNTTTLSAPSLVVVNNRKARIQVGDQIPVTQTFVNPGLGSDKEVGQVTYKDTGVILEVRPRVNPGGLVYLDVTQEVSRADDPVTPGQNVSIAKRKLDTQVAVRSGQTVLLGGLIRQRDSRGHAGVPYLSRIPLLGALFRSRSEDLMRTELVVLITPKVIASGDDAKRVVDEYRKRFRSLQPLEAVTEGAAPIAADKAG
ncbi:MAG TPA: type II secretion system secretin GspD [Luteibacter sp.]|uniref:type II secretion system secretin GspD n=1 Tax=Luteibacter sp. TaxID=1886636 RepID=UPI002B53DC8A|nr:type II secretion system secretin GspD [Luteibacter sp.]HVI54713.1 type II secretion system secretin GspD [Luteibacter sp.]